MLFTRLFNFFRGYLLVKISGRYPERLLNLCSKNNILVWDIVRGGENVVCFKISRVGFKKLRKLVRKTSCSVHIISKHGIMQVLKQYKTRKWYIFGILVFIFVMFTCDRFVWEIEIIGNESVTKDAIIKNLAECGLKKGTYRSSIDEKKIKNEMLLKMPQLSWIWPDVSGSKVLVEVKEKQETPIMINPDEYTNVISKKDGIIESMIVKSGTPMVKIGDAVLAGDVLVSGVVESKKEPEPLKPRYLRADAEVNARVWYEKSRAFSTNYIKRIETGNICKKHRLKIWGLEIKLYFEEEPEFSKYTKENYKWEFSPFGRYTGISVESDCFREITEQEEKQSSKSVIADGVLTLSSAIEDEVLPNSQLVSLNHTEEILDEDTVLVTVTAEYIENVAQMIKGKIEDQNSNESEPQT